MEEIGERKKSTLHVICRRQYDQRNAETIVESAVKVHECLRQMQNPLSVPAEFRPVTNALKSMCESILANT
uniref:Uncharacterized protein U20 n=1 Tax=Hyposoter didymator TaxID=260305 RepID=D7P5Q1_HYPDD|nr:unknown [Hyposoter didymator]